MQLTTLIIARKHISLGWFLSALLLLSIIVVKSDAPSKTRVLGTNAGQGLVLSANNSAQSLVTVGCGGGMAAWVARAMSTGGAAILCVAAIVLSLVMGAVNGVVNGNPSGAVNTKRSIPYHHPGISDLRNGMFGGLVGNAQNTSDILKVVNTMFSGTGLNATGVSRLIGYHPSGLEKRSNTTVLFDAQYLEILHFNSDYGQHVALSAGDAINTAKLVLNQASGNQKRGGEIDWASYTYDNSNRDLAERFSHFEVLDEADVQSDTSTEAMLEGYAGAGKVCASAFASGLNEVDNWEEVFENNVLHGEVYYNQYGGIDGYCNSWDDDSGASGNWALNQ